MLRVEVRLPGRLDVDFTAPEGVTALFGPSGAGKTSVVNAILGTLTPLEGRIDVDGRVLFDSAAGINLPLHQRGVACVFQDARLFPHMTVAQNLAYGRRRAGPQPPDARDKLLEMLALGPLLGRRIRHLSGGERQRVAIGRALLSGPDTLLLDEPLSALDAPRRAEILPYLESLRDAGRVPMIYVSHSMDEVARLATTLVLMEQGRVERAGPLQQVLCDPSLVAQLGLRDAGAVVEGVVAEYAHDRQLARVALSAGDIWLPARPDSLGQKMRLRIPAQDIMLATSPPRDLSAQNILKVKIVRVHPGNSPEVALQLQAGHDLLLARVTTHAVSALNLAPGLVCYAIVKATAFGPQNAGRAPDF